MSKLKYPNCFCFEIRCKFYSNGFKKSDGLECVFFFFGEVSKILSYYWLLKKKPFLIQNYFKFNRPSRGTDNILHFENSIVFFSIFFQLQDKLDLEILSLELSSLSLYQRLLQFLKLNHIFKNFSLILPKKKNNKNILELIKNISFVRILFYTTNNRSNNYLNFHLFMTH